MPAAYTGFMLKPVGSFDQNPSTALPPDQPKHSQRLEADGTLTGDLSGFGPPKGGSVRLRRTTLITPSALTASVPSCKLSAREIR